MTTLMLLLVTLHRPPLEPVGSAELGLEYELLQSFGERGPATPVIRTEDAIPGQYAVGFEPGQESAVRRWVGDQGGLVLRESGLGSDFILVRLPGWSGGAAEVATRAGHVAGVRYVEPDCRVRISHTPSDPYYAGHQWDKWVMYADQAWDVVTGGTGIRLAVVDNGTDYEHPDLAPRFVAGLYGRDIVGGDNDPRPDDTRIEQSFHGTHVAGIAAATLDNAIGVAGWANVQLVAVRVLDDSGSGGTADVAAGIDWAVGAGADIINLSLGASSSPTHLIDACRRAVDAGVLLVAAAGNEGSSSINYPAALDDCLCVGATDSEGKIATFSNHGPQQEVVAPGTEILSTGPGGIYMFAQGTSMATPEVSGVAALVMAASGLSGGRLRAVIDASAIDMGSPGRDNSYGNGLVNAARAIDLASHPARVSGTAPADRPQASLARRTLAIPHWAESAKVYTAAGQLVRLWASGDGASLVVPPGTYFVTATGPAGTRRLKAVVLD